MSNYSKNNDLDNYDAEIVEDIPEQFDLSRYRKNKSMSYRQSSSNATSSPQNGSSYTNKPSQSTQRYMNTGGNEILVDNRYSYNTLDPYSYGSYNTSKRIENMDPNLQQNKGIIYGQDYPSLQTLQISALNTLPPHLKGPHFQQIHPHHRLPYISGAPLTASSHIQAPIPQYPVQVQSPTHQLQQQQPIQQQQQQHVSQQQQSQSTAHQSYGGSGIESYGGKATYSTYQTNVAFEPQSSDYKKKHSSRTVESSLASYDNDELEDATNDDQKYTHRRRIKGEEKSKSPVMVTVHEPNERKDHQASSDYYIKDHQYSRKIHFEDGESEGSTYSDDGGKHSNSKVSSDSSHRISYNTNTLSSDSTQTLKSSLKSSKKHGVKFDEKLEVYEVNNPHYGSEAKTEKREMKKKKKDKRKEDEILFKTKMDIKSKIQAQKGILYNYYENTLLFNALNHYEGTHYNKLILKLQDKLRNNRLDEKLRDQFLQSIEKDNQTTIDIINSVRGTYANKLQQFCMQFQCQPENLHNYPGMMQTMHTIANSINYIDIINSHINKEPESGGSTLSKILGHDSKSEKSILSSLTTVKSPIKRKSDILPTKIVMSVIDSHVRDVASVHCNSLTDLIFKLKEICENDLHIVRALFKYVLLTQLDTFRNFDTGSFLMKNFDTGLESANTIFSRLCSFAGIENRCVRGLWKNITSEPGEKVDLKCLWNVVNLTSGWRFIQPAFTPVKFFSKPETKFEETEFYFLSDPDHLYYEFLPLDKIWIFGDSSVSVKDFERRPIITPHFRTIGLSIATQESNLVCNIEKEPFKLTIQYPHNLADLINFKYKLKQITGGKNSMNSLAEQNGEPHFNQYVISEIISNEDAVVFKIPALPEIGQYNFTIFADAEEPGNSQQLSLNTDNCKAVATFKLICTKIVPFETPPNHISEINLFGMNNTMKKLGLVCYDFNKGVLGTDREGKVNLVFEMLQPLDVEVYLYSSDVSISSKFLELCILKRVVHNFLIVIIYPPHPGLYGLDIHGAPRGTFNSLLHSQLPPVGKYLIKSHHQVRSFIQFPKGDNKDWGPKQRFYDLGLHAVNNTDPYIINEDGKQIDIEIAMLKPLTIWYKFDYDMNGTTKAIDNYCFMNYKTVNKRDKVVSFLLRFPYRGFYHLAIMATEVYPSKPDEIVYNYLIRVQDPASDVLKFPIIVNPILWRECSLITPKNYELSNYDTHFSVIVPNTTCVQVTTDEGNSENLEAKEIENSWVGLVSLHSAKIVHVEIEFENKIHKLIRFKGPNSH